MNSPLSQTQIQMGRRCRQLRELWSTHGMRGVTDRVRSAAAERITPRNTAMPVDIEDVLNADLSSPPPIRIPQAKPGEELVLNWVIVPAGPGSGGHTTLFRMIRHLDTLGYINRVYFYNVYGGDHQYYESIVRSAYGFHGKVCRLGDGMEDAHGVVATSWATAYPVFNSRCTGQRFYFVQDYEPYFYPVGAVSLLAENTYRMGFHAIAAGAWLAQKLHLDFGMATDFFEFGCDTTVYHREPDTVRSGLVFYARPDAARRGFELGLMAMELFAARHPEIDLHFYGDTLGKLPFRFIDHGRVTPSQLNHIYNQCFAGLSLSLTNVSLVPHEMLAAGCIPVVNEATHNRLVLDNPFVCYAPPFPQALASQLEYLATTPNFNSLSKAAAASVKGTTWEDAGSTVDLIIRRVLKCHPSTQAVSHNRYAIS